MERFGPLLLLWEGGGKGEGILRELKRVIPGLKGNWQRNGLLRFLQEKAFVSLMEDIGLLDDCRDEEEDVEDDLGSDGTVISIRYKAYKVYKDVNDLKSALAAHKPLSLVGLNDGQFGAIVKIDKEKKFVPVSRGAFVEEVCGASYFSWSLEEHQANETGGERCNQYEERIKHHCLLLPRLDGNGNAVANGNTYYMITSRWLEMIRDGTVGLPWGSAPTDDEMPVPTCYTP
jgi:hypothetical protein